MASSEEKFKAAVEAIKNLPKNGPFQPSYDMMKSFYGLYKQATEGPCTESRPAFWNAVKKIKWEAWSNLGDMSKQQAEEEYVNEMLKIIEAMPQTDEVQNFLRVMGPFFEVVSVTEDQLSRKSVANGDVVHLTNGNEEGSVQEDESTTGSVSDDVNGAPSTDERPVPNGLVRKQDLEDLEDLEVADLTSEASAPHDNGSSPDSSHPIFVEYGEEQQDAAEDQSASSTSSTDDDEEFCDSMDQPDISIERKVRFLDAEQLPVVSESLPLTSTPMSGEKITTEAEVHSIPVVGGVGNFSGNTNGHMTLDDADLQNGKHSKSSRIRTTPKTYKHQGQLMGRPSPVSDEMSEHIALVLERLQRDMNSVLVRLNTLETLAMTRHQMEAQNGLLPGSEGYGERRMKWWPFGNIDSRTVFLILVWPFIVNWVLKMLSRRRKSFRP